MNLALFVSGGLGFKVLEHLKESKHSIRCVFTDSNSESIVEKANDNRLPIFIGNPRNDRALRFIDAYEIDIILSVNYLFLIERLLFSKAKLAVNVHGSLLPKYRGRTPHVWAIINNESNTGVTAHLIDEGCDTGDILDQIALEINVKDTGNDILNKFGSLYIKIIDNVLKKAENRNLIYIKQNESHATYFGKRTPQDGLIDWNWQKERIRNWVRAQAFPYPGAFAKYKNEKIIIDEIKFVENGYNSNIKNGTIISVKPLLVKTPNGIVELKKTRNNQNHFTKMEILNSK